MVAKQGLKKAILLSGAVILVVAILFFVASLVAVEGVSIFTFRPCSLILAGVALLLFTLLKTKRTKFLFFVGVNFCFIGVMFLFLDAKAVPVTAKQIWPLCFLVAGVSLVPVCIYGTKRILAKYLVPAIIISFLGGLGLLFSLNIVQMSFRAFFAKWWPILFALAIILALVLFFRQLKIRRSFPYIVEEVDTFSDINIEGEETS